MNQSILWGVFFAIISGFLLLDLCSNRQESKGQFKQNLLWSFLWIVIALVFNGYIYFSKGPLKGIEFFTGYLIEKSLSIDNIFVFLVIFQSFKINTTHQKRILFWGVLSALVLRGILIVTGIELLEHFHGLFYVFGILLLYSAYKIGFSDHAFPLHRIFDTVKKNIPFSPYLQGEKFFIFKNKHWQATPLFLVLVVIEICDVVFAVDSVPAVLAVTTDPLICYMSNIFAILGLRSLYFVLHESLKKLHFLKKGLSFVLGYIGLKMILKDMVVISPLISLGVIGFLLLITVMASLLIVESKDLADTKKISHL